MKRFIEGADRGQSTLFPECVEDWIGEDNPVRVIDVFVEELGLAELGFGGVDPEATGRPSYHPSILLKLYIYGYLNRVQSSRRLEREAGRNVEVMWLLGRLVPDHKTIADFRKDNSLALRKVCARFVALCRMMGLLTQASVAIDGSKFKAVNNRDKNFTRAKMDRRMAQIEESVARYLQQLDTADRQEPTEALKAKTSRLKEKIAKLKDQMQRLEALKLQMLATPDQQISLTDPDSRSMATSGRGSGVVGYNVQVAVDTKHHLIVTHEVTNVGTDRSQLANVAKETKATLKATSLDVVADRGYFSSEQILACEEAGITVTLPKPMTSNSKTEGRFGKQDFRYAAEEDVYICPAGERLAYSFTTEENGLVLRRYSTNACQRCAIKQSCTTGKERRITRWEHEHLLEAVQRRLPVFDKSKRDDGTFSRSDFQYDPTSDVYHCPGGKRLGTSGTIHEGKTLLYRASKLDCNVCPLKPQCCPKEPSRKIPRDIHEHARDVARSLAGTEGFEQSRRERKKIEMRFAHLKRMLRLGRLRLRGPRGAQDEFVLAAIAQNLRRLASLVGRPPPTQALCFA
jgi:transposase